LLRVGKQKSLYPTPGLFRAHQTGRNNARIVNHEKVSGSEELDNIFKDVMGGPLRFPFQNHQLGLIPRRYRNLGNEFFGKSIRVIF
jgi:hypothetical protein